MSDASPAIDAAVQALLQQHVHSFEQLELLLLLRKHYPREWTLAAAASALGIAAADAVDALDELQKAGMLTHHGTGQSRVFSFDPTTKPLAMSVDKLADAYEQQRIEIMKLMSQNAIERVRAASLRRVADAFIMRRKKDG